MNPSPVTKQALSLGLLVSLVGFALLSPSTAAAGEPETPQADGRVVVVGFDGADSRTVERMMAEGRLPNLKALADGGTFGHLESTNPAESAAGWAALNTGQNPLKNGVPSFINRLPSGSVAYPNTAHISIDKKRFTAEELEELLRAPEEPGSGVRDTIDGLSGKVGGSTTLAAIIGIGAALLFFALFKVLLKANAGLAGVLSLLIGAGGAAAVAGTGAAAEDDKDTGSGAQSAELGNDLPVDTEVTVYSTKVTEKGFWDHAAAGGKQAIVLDAALAFGQPETPGARVLGGLGLPDVRGAMNGNWFIYTNDDLEMNRPPEGYKISRGGKSNTGTIFRVDERDGKIETQVFGPVNFTKALPLQKQIDDLQAQLSVKGIGWKESTRLREERDAIQAQVDSINDSNEADKHRVSLPLTMETKGDKLAITIAGTTHNVAEGEWSGWFQLPFRMNGVVSANAVTRAHVISLADPLKVYFNTFDLDPSDPPFWQPVSAPRSFSKDLVDWTGGPFETLGWSCMTNQMKDAAIPIDMFVQDIEFTMKWRERLTYTVLERDDWELLFSVFSSSDRVQHIMYRYHDPEHPKHDPEEAEREVMFFGKPTKLRDVVPAIYEQIDRVVGEIVSRLDDADHLLLCADHGFTSYRRGLEVNNWLAEEGYLSYHAPTGSGSASIASAVDWSQTRAYSLGLGMIYVNMAGREQNGIVAKDEAKALLKEIGDKLVALTDAGPEDAPFAEPQSVVLDYKIMPDLYTGSELEWGDAAWPCSDLMIGFDEYYRTSWTTVGGSMRFVKDEVGDPVLGPIVRPNTNNWSGDHASNSPALVTGIFFSRKPIVMPEDGVHVMHFAPTVLSLLGLPVPAEMDLAPLEFQ